MEAEERAAAVEAVRALRWHRLRARAGAGVGFAVESTHLVLTALPCLWVLAWVLLLAHTHDFGPLSDDAAALWILAGLGVACSCVPWLLLTAVLAWSGRWGRVLVGAAIYLGGWAPPALFVVLDCVVPG